MKPEPPDTFTDIELMLALYRNPRTRDVALELADKNRETAKERKCVKS